ncbi:MAG TPA: helix-turn-helix domain-containing protein [Streptosporangiaceae bacterium]|jgi:transcriptional regulator with XRE-family HTH domain
MAASTELGGFLRARRGRLRPADVGLPSGPGPRRTPGLRREELAALAGLSIDYYIRLEQGKETNPSTAILDGLARALHLTEEEHAHLYTLANHAARRTRPSSPRAVLEVRAGLRLLLETVRPCPAYVLNRVNDVLAANPEGLALFAGLGEWPAHRRNTVRYVFRHPAARTLYPDWADTARATAANLRARTLTTPDSPDLAALVEELAAHSDAFARLWRRYDLEYRRSQAKTFHHPEIGDVTLGFETLRIDDGLRLNLYQAEPGTPDHDALRLLALARTP